MHRVTFLFEKGASESSKITVRICPCVDQLRTREDTDVYPLTCKSACFLSTSASSRISYPGSSEVSPSGWNCLREFVLYPRYDRDDGEIQLTYHVRVSLSNSHLKRPGASSTIPLATNLSPCAGPALPFHRSLTRTFDCLGRSEAPSSLVFPVTSFLVEGLGNSSVVVLIPPAPSYHAVCPNAHSQAYATPLDPMRMYRLSQSRTDGHPKLNNSHETRQNSCAIPIHTSRLNSISFMCLSTCTSRAVTITP